MEPTYLRKVRKFNSVSSWWTSLTGVYIVWVSEPFFETSSYFCVIGWWFKVLYLYLFIYRLHSSSATTEEFAKSPSCLLWLFNVPDRPIDDCFFLSQSFLPVPYFLLTFFAPGFTLYNELTYPFTTQILLFDHDHIQLLRYQLNSLVSLWQVEDCSTPYNLVWFSPKVKLFEFVDSLPW